MTVKNARGLRKRSTEAERLLWARLRNRKAAGLKFRRQHPVDGRVVDFFCEDARLAIELDGSGHATHLQQSADLDREIELHENGIRLLRFWNQQVFDNLDEVVNAIIYAVDPEKSLWSQSTSDCPHLDPLPEGEE
jgi:very-short-patch-repair endonuclease